MPLFKRHMPSCLHFLAAVSLLFSALAQAQSGDAKTTEVSMSLVDNAISQAEANVDLSDEAKAQLIESYRRTQGYIKGEQAFRQSTARFKSARENAAEEAAAIRKQLEKDAADWDGTEPPPSSKLSLDEVEQLVQKDKADLAATETKAADVANQLEREAGRPNAIRTRLTELKQLQDELAAQSKVAADPSEGGITPDARKWLLLAQSAAVRAELATLDEELLSQPMRLELLNAQSDRGNFDVARYKERIKVYELHVIKLRQGEAEKAQVAAESAQEEAQGKHPLILQLAQANAQLSGAITERTTALEKLKAEESQADDMASTLESDLQSMQRKLEVLGMSQALGRILREQRLRLPDSTYSRADMARRDELITASSLRQFEYEDERQKLRSIRSYVDDFGEEVDPLELESIRADLTELAEARRDLINRAIDVEGTYLRTLGEVDFAARRLIKATDAYRDFITERLLWIRTSASISLDTFKPLPGELAVLFAPAQWLDVFQDLINGFFSSALYPLMLLVSGLLLRYRGRLLERLEATAVHVGDVDKDSFTNTWKALGYTAALAVTMPFIMLTAGLSIGHDAGPDGLAAGLTRGLTVMSGYYLGLEFLHFLLVPQGLVQKHFRWSEATVLAVANHLRQLTLIFVPSVLLAILASFIHPNDAESTLSSLMLVVALLAIARFYARFPNIMQGHLDQLLRLRGNPRRSLMSSMVRYFMIVVPCLLVVGVLLGYRHTATSFLALLLLTNALIAGLLLVHEFGIRWLRILRRRLIQREREAAAEEARLRAEAIRSGEGGEGDEIIEENFDEPDPDALDEEGRKLLNMIVAVTAIFGIWGVWADVLPALGILDSVTLWQTTELVNGVDTAVPVTLADFCVAGLIGFAGYVATQRIPALLEILLRNRMQFAAGTVYAGVTLFQYVLVTLVVVMVLGSLGADWSQIQWAVAALSVGIGFGLQEIVANFISGLILLFEQPIRVGDTVTVGDTSSVVTKIRMRATTIRNWDRRELLVPNKEFITGRLLNWSLSDKINRTNITVGVAYGTDLNKAMELVMEVAQEHPEVVDDPAPFVTFDDFGDNALVIVLRAYLADMDRLLSVSSQMRLMINDKLNDAGIVVAFPQRDVHLDTSSPLTVDIRNLDGGRPAE